MLPAAPWVFGAAALAYVVAPSIVAPQARHHQIAFATLLTALTLGAGAATQATASRLPEWTQARLIPVALALTAAGTAICASEAALNSVTLAIATSLVLGVAYGAGMLGGLTQIQQLADEHDLGGLTGIFCSLTYTGFLLPVVLTELSSALPESLLLLILAALAAGCCLISASALTLDRPTTSSASRTRRLTKER